MVEEMAIFVSDAVYITASDYAKYLPTYFPLFTMGVIKITKDIRSICRRIRNAFKDIPVANPVVNWNGLKLPFIIGRHGDRAIVLHRCHNCNRFVHWTPIVKRGTQVLSKFTCSNCGNEVASFPVFEEDVPLELTREELLTLMDRLCPV